jgi:hypothetical protein
MNTSSKDAQNCCSPREGGVSGLAVVFAQGVDEVVGGSLEIDRGCGLGADLGPLDIGAEQLEALLLIEGRDQRDLLAGEATVDDRRRPELGALVARLKRVKRGDEALDRLAVARARSTFGIDQVGLIEQIDRIRAGGVRPKLLERPDQLVDRLGRLRNGLCRIGRGRSGGRGRLIRAATATGHGQRGDAGQGEQCPSDECQSQMSLSGFSVTSTRSNGEGGIRTLERAISPLLA